MGWHDQGQPDERAHDQTRPTGSVGEWVQRPATTDDAAPDDGAASVARNLPGAPPPAQTAPERTRKRRRGRRRERERQRERARRSLIVQPAARLGGAVGGAVTVAAERMDAVLDRRGRAIVRVFDQPWLLGIALVAAMVLLAGTAYLMKPETAPTYPYLPVGGVEEVPAPVLDQDRDILFVPVDDDILAFDATQGQPRYCARSNRLESAEGRVWSLNGEPLDGGTPLQRYPSTVYGDTIYVDMTRTVSAGEGTDQGARPVCTE